jgi:hypothetical protein
MVAIPVPKNTSFVVINGTRGPDFGPISINYMPVPTLGQSPITLDLYSKWYAPDVMVQFMPLNPDTL